jgi:hypothetical protein
MNKPERMELFSRAYVEAVAAASGYDVTRPTVDDDSVDGIILSRVGRRARIEFQLKATGRDLIREEHIHFPLPRKNYDDLRVETLVPRVLIVVTMPEAEGDWIVQSPEQLSLRHCGYYRALLGAQEVDNKYQITVAVPLANVFSVDMLRSLMDRAERGDPL